MSRRTKRRRVLASRVSSPRKTFSARTWPRPRSPRSTSEASPNANTRMTAARIQWLDSGETSAAAMPTSAAVMPAQPSRAPRAVLLDALGTLVTFEAPAPHLRAALRERLGADVGPHAAEAAIRAEIAFYRAHLHEGRDAASLEDLRARSAAAMRAALPEPAASAPGAVLTAALMASLRFAAFPEVPGVLRAL